ncbi:MAG: ECF-type sigma factor [Phycisphaerales bacterium]|nr:ECF-type sigma factor [Phycisphaerales bacterium]
MSLPLRANRDVPTQPRSVRELLAAMGAGEREAAAEFVQRYGPQIRRRVRGKLRTSMRRLFDSQDILSTLSRRLDSYVHRGLFEPRSEEELWGLVFMIAEHSVVEKARIWQALSEKEGEQSGLAGEAAGRFDRAARGTGVVLAEEDEFEGLLESVPHELDRQIARLWAMNLSSEAIATELGLTVDVVRTRWRRTRDQLRFHFAQEPM